jgi:S1-C subfamily serine protease
MVLEAAPEVPPRNVTTLKGEQPLSGATVANMSPALGEELSLDPMRRGIIVFGTHSRSPARRIGLKPGDWILEINNIKVKLVRDLKQVLRKVRPQWRIKIQRKNRVFTATIEG